MGINVRFTPDDWQRIRRDWSAWWAGELDRPMVILTGWDPPAGRTLPEAPGFGLAVREEPFKRAKINFDLA